MKTLILKLNATGDVLRTTPLLRCIAGHVTWITAARNVPLLEGLQDTLTCLPWEDRALALDDTYDLLVNLEDEVEVSQFAAEVDAARRFGAFLGTAGTVRYTPDSRGWFDLSLISTHGREAADRLKLLNRRTYQDLIFEGLGHTFEDQRYMLPATAHRGLSGDVAIAPLSGPVWPMKSWDHYAELQRRLESSGLTVNVLPTRNSLLEHIADVRGHRCLVSGDSLPMHIALGAGVPCVTIFNCTSPWEIHPYGLQTKIVSPRLAEFFYQRGLDPRATSAVALDDVHGAVMTALAMDATQTP